MGNIEVRKNKLLEVVIKLCLGHLVRSHVWDSDNQHLHNIHHNDAHVSLIYDLMLPDVGIKEGLSIFSYFRVKRVSDIH